MNFLNKSNRAAPLLCWDIYVEFYHDLLSNFRKDQIIKDLQDFKNKFDWEIDLKELISSNDFDAVVVTNNKQEIQYTSQGFKKLTGYPFSYTKGKSPKFLQGEKTCSETRKKIRNYIQKEKPFEEEVINYRKTGEVYSCLIMVYPVKNSENKITHFIALEREMKISAA